MGVDGRGQARAGREHRLLDRVKAGCGRWWPWVWMALGGVGARLPTRQGHELLARFKAGCGRGQLVGIASVLSTARAYTKMVLGAADIIIHHR